MPPVIVAINNIIIYKKSIDAKHQRASKQEIQQVKMN
jgi:hypothetical protein